MAILRQENNKEVSFSIDFKGNEAIEHKDDYRLLSKGR